MQECYHIKPILKSVRRLSAQNYEANMVISASNVTTILIVNYTVSTHAPIKSVLRPLTKFNFTKKTIHKQLSECVCGIMFSAKFLY